MNIHEIAKWKAFGDRLGQCHVMKCTVTFWCPTYGAERTTKVCENCCGKYGECDLCDTVQEAEEATERQCQMDNALRCTVCGKHIEDGQTYYEHEGIDEHNCSVDCLNVAMDSNYGIGRWRNDGHSDGREVFYSALINGEWTPLSITLTLMQEELAL